MSTRIAYFDCTAGISGDMVLGALVDAGLPFDRLEEALSRLSISEFSIRHEKVQKAGIAATRVTVDAKEGHVHRGLSDVLSILDGSDLTETVTAWSRAIFERLAQAEAEVHGVTVEEVHFHEVGAVDAIVDVVGAAIGLELLGIDEIHSSVLRFGRGATKAAHGPLPVPVPAVVALCKEFPSERTRVPAELVTPTGAAILTTLAASVGESVRFKTREVGYGAGSREIEGVANVLRVEIGDLDSSQGLETAVLIETNIDDMTPEVYGFLLERLLDQGAKDAFITPIIMKKGRPGVTVSVLCDPARAEGLADLLLRETTTLGVRSSIVHRKTLERRSETVDTPYGTVRVKVADFEGRIRTAPEYEDCARIAREQNVPILDVYKAAQQG